MSLSDRVITRRRQMKLSRAIPALLTTLLATGCGTASSTARTEAPNKIVDSLCTVDRPIITHGSDADVMDIRTVRAINEHNDLWVSICGQPKK
jgi:hypothetical protein